MTKRYMGYADIAEYTGQAPDARGYYRLSAYMIRAIDEELGEPDVEIGRTKGYSRVRVMEWWDRRPKRTLK